MNNDGERKKRNIFPKLRLIDMFQYNSNLRSKRSVENRQESKETEDFDTSYISGSPQIQQMGVSYPFAVNQVYSAFGSVADIARDLFATMRQFTSA